MTEKQKNVFVCQLEKEKVQQLRNDLTAKGFEFSEIPHALFSARQGKLALTLYKSLKLVVQGKEAKEFIEFYLEPQLLQDFSLSYKHVTVAEDFKEHIGVDESGKGDYFGPLVIASAFAEKDKIGDLVKIGVKDCKKLTDKKVNELYHILRKKIKYSIVTIGPERYNLLYEKMSNLNRMLAWGHARAIENLLLKVTCENVLLDKFSSKDLVAEALMKRGRKVSIEQKTHAEEDIVVAAASVLARGEFLLRLKQLGEEIGMELPRGAGAKVDQAAIRFIEEKGMTMLSKVAKLHFRTTKKVIMS